MRIDAAFDKTKKIQKKTRNKLDWIFKWKTKKKMIQNEILTPTDVPEPLLWSAGA